MEFTRRTYLFIAAGALFLVLIYFSVFRAPAVTVETARVDRGEVISSVEAEGRTRYHERFVITAPVTGRMFRVQLHEGDRVPKGYVLTRIDPTPTRPLDPVQNPLVGVQPYAYNVYVPEDGILTRILVTSEGVVQAGTPIAEVSKPSLLEIVADVLSTDATQIRAHMPIRIENWGGEGTLRARVRLIEPQAFTKVSSLGVEEQRVNVIGDFITPPEGLGDNYRIDVKFILWEGGNVLRVPSTALFRNGEEWNVYAVEGSVAKRRTVTIGHRSPSFTEISSGLIDGETVILHPPTSVDDGSRVRSN